MNFIKNQCWLKLRRANLDQQYACLKKVLLHPTSAVVFVDNVSSSSGRKGDKGRCFVNASLFDNLSEAEKLGWCERL